MLDVFVTRIMAVANQKGGVGKTTTALNLGVLLARMSRVLFVDLDPQASLTTFLGVDSYRVERSSYSLLMFEGMSLARSLRTLNSSMALVPGSIDLAAAAIKIVQDGLPLARLREVLRQSRVAFDYVVIDTPPGLNVLTVIGLMAADEVIIPTQCSQTAVMNIRAIQDVIWRVRDHMGNPDLKVRGVLPTLFDNQAIYAQTVLDELRALMPGQIFKTVIPYDVRVADAPHKGKAVVDYAPESLGALAYRQLAAEITAG